jgi:hypothetical protein
VQKIKDFIYKRFAYLFIIFTALCICGGVYLFHVSSTIHQHDGASVQHVEEYNNRATDAVQHATDKIATAQAKLSRTNGKLERAVGRAQELQRGAASNTGIIDECQSRLNRCQELLSDAESIYKDVERGDRFAGENE